MIITGMSFLKTTFNRCMFRIAEESKFDFRKLCGAQNAKLYLVWREYTPPMPRPAFDHFLHLALTDSSLIQDLSINIFITCPDYHLKNH
jgi:hypothetical protein